jgi:putative copper export protein
MSGGILSGTLAFLVMAGHSRPKDGVLSHAYVPAIHVFCINAWMPGIKPGMTEK